MAASATFTVNSTATTEAVAVSASSTVNLALVSTTGVDVVQWSIVGNHAPGLTNPTITAAGSPNGATATFPMPAGVGQSYLVKCVVNPGRDDEDSKTAMVGVLNASGRIPFALGEELERHATYGWTVPLNQISATAPTAIGGANTVLTSSGTAVSWSATPTVTSLTATSLLHYGGTSGPKVRTGESSTAVATSSETTVLSFDATVTPLAADCAITIAAIVHVRQAASGDHAFFARRATFVSIADVVTQLGSTETVGTDALTAGALADGWTCTIDASADDVRVRFQNPAWASAADDVVVKTTVEYAASVW